MKKLALIILCLLPFIGYTQHHRFMIFSSDSELLSIIKNDIKHHYTIYIPVKVKVQDTISVMIMDNHMFHEFLVDKKHMTENEYQSYLDSFNTNTIIQITGNEFESIRWVAVDNKLYNKIKHDNLQRILDRYFNDICIKESVKKQNGLLLFITC